MDFTFLAQEKFVPRGPSHWAVLALFLLAAIALVREGRAQRGTPTARRFSRIFAVVLLAFEITLQIYSMLPANWDLGTSLPFQLCDLAWMACACALWTHRPWAFGLLYYWGLTLTSQALITPQLEFDFPHLQFIMFWGSHSMVFLAAIYMTWGLGFRPTWRSFRLAAAATTGWGFLMLLFNSAAGTNYLYVNKKPPGKSILDLLGEWPWYVLNEVAVMLALWALMTLPWSGRPSGWRQERAGE